MDGLPRNMPEPDRIVGLATTNPICASGRLHLTGVGTDIRCHASTWRPSVIGLGGGRAMPGTPTVVFVGLPQDPLERLYISLGDTPKVLYVEQEAFGEQGDGAAFGARPNEAAVGFFTGDSTDTLLALWIQKLEPEDFACGLCVQICALYPALEEATVEQLSSCAYAANENPTHQPGRFGPRDLFGRALAGFVVPNTPF